MPEMSSVIHLGAQFIVQRFVMCMSSVIHMLCSYVVLEKGHGVVSC